MDTYKYIIKYINKSKDKIIFYFGVPAFATLSIMKNINTTELINYPNNVYLIEKPFGNSLNQYMDYCGQIRHRYLNDKILFVDHYRVKNDLINMKLCARLMGIDELRKITIIINEMYDVDDRIDYFDSYGLINDMFQSHVLSILQYILGDKFYNTKRFTINKLSVGQYRNYPVSNSNTETYMNVSISWNDVDIVIVCGKKMTCDVRKVMLEYEDQPMEIFDFLSSGKTDYFNLFSSIIDSTSDKHKDLFLHFMDNINFWNITNKIHLYKKNIELFYY